MNDQQMENKRKHLDLIQGVINRLAHNSFLIKGWMITVALAGMGISLNIGLQHLSIMTAISILLFWFLDSYYLRLEKLFRKHFEHVATSEGELRFDMDVRKYKKEIPNIFKIMFSMPTVILYLPLLIFVAMRNFCF